MELINTICVINKTNHESDMGVIVRVVLFAIDDEYSITALLIGSLLSCKHFESPAPVCTPYNSSG